MMDDGEQPLLFLDVDGTLIPFGRGKHGIAERAVNDSYLARLNPQLGPQLAALPCELVWATTWEDEANAEVAPRLGLPPLRVVHWREPLIEGELEDQWFNLRWKTRALMARAEGRQFAWADDEITDADVDWVATHYPKRALLHPVVASQGLTRHDLEVLSVWFRDS